MNPYHQWLGLAAEVTSPNYYELLGLRLGEGAVELIGSAADGRSRRVEPYLAGEQGLSARRILDEIAVARCCLLDPQAKAAYDQQLGVAGGEDRPLSPHLELPRKHKQPCAGTEPAAGERADSQPAAAETAGRETGGSPAPQRRERETFRPPPRMPSGGPGNVLRPLEPATHLPRVPIVGKLALEAILAELAAAMQECRELYLSCVTAGARSATARQLASRQDRLHRGLLAKIYSTIAEADGRWTYEEQRCVATLLEHVGVARPAEELEQTARRVAQQAARLDWSRLLRPFQEIPLLCRRAADLETLVLRIANLIAKADGVVAPAETAALHAMQAELRWPQRSSGDCGATPAAADVADEEDLPWVGQIAPRRTRSTRAGAGKRRTECLQQLDALVGLGDVKREIRQLADWANLQDQRRRAGLSCEPTDLRFIFLGCPGSGKSLTAWRMSELLAVSGGLRFGQLVEVDGFDLVSRPPNAAAAMVRERFREALGGTLLVDHAAALLSADEAAAGGVLRILEQNLVAHADRLAVVLADPSERLLTLLDRRAAWQPLFRRHWHFGDYRAGELGRIFQFHCDRSHYQVTRAAQIKLLLGFDWQLRHNAEPFGAGHGVLRVFERAVQQLASRIAGITPLTKEVLTTFHDADITFGGVPQQVFGSLADPRRLFTIHCPGCDSRNVVGPEWLGIRVECNRCRQRFVCAWGDPGEES
jgi:tellurite resistance protein